MLYLKSREERERFLENMEARISAIKDYLQIHLKRKDKARQ